MIKHAHNNTYTYVHDIDFTNLFLLKFGPDTSTISRSLFNTVVFLAFRRSSNLLFSLDTSYSSYKVKFKLQSQVKYLYEAKHKIHERLKPKLETTV